MVDVETFSVAVASIGVILAAITYVLEMRYQTRIRKTDLLIDLFHTYTDKEFADAEQDVMGLEFKDLNEYREKYGSGSHDSEEQRKIGKSLSVVFGFYELVGTLLYRKYIDLVLVNDVFSYADVKRMYEKVKPLILGLRKEKNEPFENAGFEYLYAELQLKRQQLRKTWAKALLQSASDTNSSTNLLGVKNG